MKNWKIIALMLINFKSKDLMSFLLCYGVEEKLLYLFSNIPILGLLASEERKLFHVVKDHHTYES